MKIEKKIHATGLRSFLKKTYGLNVKTMTFVPKGEVAYSYRIACVDGKRFFLKIHPDDHDITKREFEALLLLRKTYHLKNISVPVKNLAGKVESRFMKTTSCMLFDFIDGKDLEESHLSAGDMQKIAGLLAQVHGIVLKPGDSKRFKKEAFIIDYVVDGMKTLFRAFPNPTSQIQRALRDYLKANKKNILKAFSHLQRIQKIVRKTKLSLVLTHGDPHSNNFMKVKTGELFLIDWDLMKLAPRERDVWFYLEDPHGRFLNDYRAAGGSQTLNPEVIEFYIYHRHLADLVHWAKRILSGINSHRQNKNDLTGIKTWCNFKTLDKVFEKINACLPVGRAY